MEELDSYIFVAALRTLRGFSQRHVALMPSELTELIWNRYQVSFLPEEVSAVFKRAAERAGSDDLIEHVVSSFAADRFIVKTEALRDVALFVEVDELWDRAVKVGDGWLSESLSNIRGRLQSSDVDQADSTPLEFKSVPASDRYVSTADNQKHIDEISSDIEAIRREVESSNSIEDEDRLITLSEIAIFETAICQPRLAQDIIERFLRFCATKLSNWIGGAVVGYLIDKLKLLLDMFFSSLSAGG